MVANDVQAYDSTSPIRDAIAKGEIDVGLINHYYVARGEGGGGRRTTRSTIYFPPGDLGSLVNVAGVGVLASSERKEEAFDFVRSCSRARRRSTSPTSSKEYPLVDGVADRSGLPPLAEIARPGRRPRGLRGPAGHGRDDAGDGGARDRAPSSLGRARGRPAALPAGGGARRACGRARCPLVYLAIVVGGDLSAATEKIWSSRSLELIVRSVGLAAAVTATAIAIAVPLAWLTGPHRPAAARAIWATLATLPLVIPSYIGAYLFVSALGPSGALQGLLEPLGVDRLPSIYGFAGAWLVLTPLHVSRSCCSGSRSAAAAGPAARGGRARHGPLAAARPSAPSSCPQLGRRSAPAALLVALYVL